MKKDRKDKYNNGFLISCVSCILMLLAVCYFGINATTMKGTAAATSTASCPSGLYAVSHSSNTYCCPVEYTSVDFKDGKAVCVLSGTTIAGSQFGDTGCVTWSEEILDDTVWQCEFTINNVTFENGYTCTAPSKACVVDAVTSSTITEYDVIYDGNGGTVKGSSSVSATTVGGGTIQLLGINDVKRDGYTFLGWATDKNATAAGYTGYGTYKFTTDVTLYAIWQQDVVEYTITYDGNGGIFKQSSSTSFAYQAPAGTITLLGDADVSKSNYTLIGWSLVKNATTASLSKGGSYNVTGNVTLYAIWEENKTSIAKPTNTLCKSNVVYNGSTQVMTTATSGTGFTLSGYSAKNAGSYSVTATLSSGYKWSDGSTGTATFKCTIAKATPVVSLNKSSLSIIEGQTETFTEQANVNGSFANSSKNTNVATVSPTSNTGVSANNIKTETVTGRVAGTTSISVVFTPTDTTNYTTATKTLSVSVVKVSGEEEDDDEVQSSTFTATFNPNGGTISGTSSLSCTTTTSSCVVTGLPIASKSGHNFKGWGETSSCAVGNTTKLTLTANKTYYACWEKIEEPPKNVDENPGTGDFMIAIVAILGVASVAYLVYYYKKFENNL